MNRPIYLLQPPTNIGHKTPCLDDKQFGLGVLAIAAYLKRAGYKVIAKHVPNLIHNSNCTIDDIVSDIAKANPMLVAIGLNWVHFSRGAIQVARLLRQVIPQTPILVGGQHATLFAQEIVQNYSDAIDGVVVGEAEKTLLAICDELNSVSHASHIPEVPGLLRAGYLYDDCQNIFPLVEELDNLPFYSFETLQKRKGEPDVAAVSTCRGGCPYKCAFCVEHVIGSLQGREKLQFHSADWIANHIEFLTKQGIRRITIQDSFFIAGDKLICQVSDILKQKNVRLEHLNIFSHPNSFGEDGFCAMRAIADVASVDFGVETGSSEVGKKIGRPFKGETVVEQVTKAVNAGVIPYTWWLAGLPDAKDAMRDTQELVIETMAAGAIPRWVSPLVLLPQTPMHNKPEDYGIEVRFHDFQDYCRFSDTSLVEALSFNDLITHRTEERSYDGIQQEAQDLRRHISENFEFVKQFWSRNINNAKPPDLEQTHSRIQASFF